LPYGVSHDVDAEQQHGAIWESNAGCSPALRFFVFLLLLGFDTAYEQQPKMLSGLLHVLWIIHQSSHIHMEY